MLRRLSLVLALSVFWLFPFAQETPERILQQAIAAHRSGNMEAAIQQYRAYLKLRPDARDARSNLGAALASTGRYTDAIAEYQQERLSGPLPEYR